MNNFDLFQIYLEKFIFVDFKQKSHIFINFSLRFLAVILFFIDSIEILSQFLQISSNI